MTLWSAEIKELETLFTSIKGRFPELEKELERLIKADDENMVLLYSRRCLEVIIADLCESELKRPRKTEPLKGIIDKLSHEEKVPSNIIASMQSLNSLSTFGAHPKEFDPEQVKPVLNNLTTIIKWYLKYKDTLAISKPKAEKVIDETRTLDDSKKQIQKLKKRLIFLLSGLLLVVIIVVVVLFLFNVIGGKKETQELEKSIAVLPFIDDSQDRENTAFINGIMDEVLINLQTIKDLRVPGRTSVEQYRKATKSIPEIAKELGVNYIVEGSGQKYGNTFRIRVQLIEAAKDKHLWGDSYEQEIQNVKDIFNIQSHIAHSIANELKAIITPEEKQLIEKTPTTSLTAYDFYQRGKDEYIKYLIDNTNRAALEKAEDFYHKALDYDSTFAQAYLGLARVYWNKHYWKEYFSENFMDSVLFLTDIALSFDDQLAEANTIWGEYYRQIGDKKQAIEKYDKAIKLNPNDWIAYWGKGLLYEYDDFVKSIDNLQKAAFLNHGDELPVILGNLGSVYSSSGFIERGKYYFQEVLKLSGDSTAYYIELSWHEFFYCNFEKTIEFLEKGYTIDSNNVEILNRLGFNYMLLGQYEEALKYYKKWYERLKALGTLDLTNMHRIGYTYWKNGYKKEAEYYFNKQIEYCNRMNELGRPGVQQFQAYYDLAGIYAFRGETDKTYENLRIFNQKQRMPSWIVTIIKNDPLFDSIRDEPEFQQIVRDVEAKYQAEHERVRKWLEENDLPG
jgi:TolB-like protein/Flp pilus assembly protein TadD